MMVIELREAAYEKAFDLLDEALLENKELKMVLCALEDAIYECYDASKDGDYEHEDEQEYDDEEEYRDREDFEIPSAKEDDMNYRADYGERKRRGMRGERRYEIVSYRKGMRGGMRHRVHNAMRRNMRKNMQ